MFRRPANGLPCSINGLERIHTHGLAVNSTARLSRGFHEIPALNRQALERTKASSVLIEQ